MSLGTLLAEMEKDANRMEPEQAGEVAHFARAYQRVPSSSMWPEIGRLLIRYRQRPTLPTLRALRVAVVTRQLLERYGDHRSLGGVL